MMSPLPLFNAPLVKEVQQLNAQRARLTAQITALTTKSHRRIALQDRLQQLTIRALQAEGELSSKGKTHA